MIARAFHLDRVEATGCQQTCERSPGEHVQVAGDLAAWPTEYSAEADLGEDRLHPEGKQTAVVPGGQVRRGQQERAVWLQDPEGFIERRVSVDECSITSLMITTSAEAEASGRPDPSTPALIRASPRARACRKASADQSTPTN